MEQAPIPPHINTEGPDQADMDRHLSGQVAPLELQMIESKVQIQ